MAIIPNFLSDSNKTHLAPLYRCFKVFLVFIKSVYTTDLQIRFGQSPFSSQFQENSIYHQALKWTVILLPTDIYTNTLCYIWQLRYLEIIDFYFLNGDQVSPGQVALGYQVYKVPGYPKDCSALVIRKPIRKYCLFLPHLQKWKGRWGGTTEAFLHGLFLCPSSALFLLLTLMRKCAFPAPVKEAWR